MLIDALEKAAPYLEFPTRQGTTCRLSEAIEDPVAYCTVKDSIIDMIALSSDSRLGPAKAILARLQKRQMYKCVGRTDMTGAGSKMKGEWSEAENAWRVESPPFWCASHGARDHLTIRDF